MKYLTQVCWLDIVVFVTNNPKQQKLDFAKLLNKPKPTAEEKAKMQKEALSKLQVLLENNKALVALVDEK